MDSEGLVGVFGADCLFGSDDFFRSEGSLPVDFGAGGVDVEPGFGTDGSSGFSFGFSLVFGAGDGFSVPAGG